MHSDRKVIISARNGRNKCWKGHNKCWKHHNITMLDEKISQ